jgi:hypothetical protein
MLIFPALREAAAAYRFTTHGTARGWLLNLP